MQFYYNYDLKMKVGTSILRLLKNVSYTLACFCKRLATYPRLVRLSLVMPDLPQVSKVQQSACQFAKQEAASSAAFPSSILILGALSCRCLWA